MMQIQSQKKNQKFRNYKNNYNKYNEYNRVADKLANGERLNAEEREIARRLANNNCNYNGNYGCIGRRYKDF